jgi:CRISPR-associated endonuclease/helicase Cas3
MMPSSPFAHQFKFLTDHDPFPWQSALYDRFMNGDIPKSCNIPTGLGKTAVIAVWLIALANKPDFPRRLVYIVNRRTVVDQTTVEVEKYRIKLPDLGISDPLALSTLRGQFADNREWSADPSRPAVICGTVDMIGSRLLFSGYGCGFKTRPLHAGFLGQDSLLIHDEAHLEPAFQKLIEAIRDEQVRCNDFHPIKVIELTATSRSEQAVFELSDSDRENKIVQQRMEATKKLQLCGIDTKRQPAEEIARHALDLGKHHAGAAILVFVRTVEDVDTITRKLPNDACVQLTGTLRGLERDRLVKNPIFQRFLPSTNRDGSETPAEGTVYLVCTSAGEVGVNISADHLVCDLTPFESMAQRFGRVNRFGDRDDTEIHVVHPTEFDDKDPLGIPRQRTLELLGKLDGNASPAALGNLDSTSRQAAFTPPPTILPTSDILFDAWSLTTIRDTLPGRPHVEPFLHGIAEWQPPETYVAWREEVDRITGDLLEKYAPEDLLEDYPLKPHELLRDRSDRVARELAILYQRHRDRSAWILTDSGRIEIVSLEKLSSKENRDRINNTTLLLPPSVGGLNEGRLNGSSEHANDVSSEWFDENNNRRRLRIWDDEPAPDGMRLIRTIDTDPDADEDSESQRFWRWYELPASAETEGSRSSRQPVALSTHTKDVVGAVSSIVERLDLPEPLQRVFRIAAECHDMGKKRRVFQTVLGNRDYPAGILAKSGKAGGRLDEHYRHEFGSLLDVRQCPEFNELDPDDQDLVLHLIAAHHGRARPHFPADEAFDPERPHTAAEQMAAEVPRRFARLQRKYGRWGLAYLESLLRAADYAASSQPSQFMEADTQ